MLKRGSALRIPAPPTMRNHRNHVASLSQLGRWLAERAEEGGATILPETSADRLLVDHGRVLGVRTGDRGRGRDGGRLKNFEPGSDLVARVTVLCEGTQGHLTGAALDRFALHGEHPQTWALGVKEVWKVAKPLDHMIHTMGWPLRGKKKYREFGGSFIYPMGDDMVTVGMVVGLDYRDAELSVHDLLQELKTHRLVRKILTGGERIGWGAKTIPEGGFVALPKRFNAPGLMICGDGAGLVNVPALKGIHYAVESGRLAAETAFAAFAARASRRARRGALDGTTSAARELRVERPEARAQHAPGVRQRLPRRRREGQRRDATLGQDPAERRADRGRRLAPASSAPTAPSGIRRPTGSSPSTSSRRSSSAGTRRATTCRTTSASSTVVPRELAEAWVRMCPAQVYEVGGDAGDGLVHVEVTPSNCVQCGAITAKGGRLTPPEGGSGPEYTLT